jgi:DeoR/GlpR family transcriptional regulator of sugar metabolism
MGRSTRAEQRERQSEIMDFVTDGTSRSIGEIAEFAGVSQMTAYRDIAELESQGMLRRNHGLVTAAATHLHEASARFRLVQDVPDKRALAAAAMEFIEPGSSVMLDDSTTGVQLAKLLVDAGSATVITNFNPVARTLEGAEGIQLFLSGGEYEPWADAYFGPMAVSAIRSMRADVVAMSASAIADGLCFHPSLGPVELKRAMMESSALKILYADHTKFGRTALHVVGPLTDFDVVILDSETPQEIRERLSDMGVKVSIAEPVTDD